MTDWDDGRTPSAAPQPTLGKLFEQLSEQATRLVRSEIALAKAELTSKAKASGIGAGLLAGAAVIVLYAVGVLIWAAVIGLAEAWPLWLSALVVGVVMLLLAGVLAMLGVRTFKKVASKPETIDRVKDDIATVKGAVKGDDATGTTEEARP
ncbi:phage holin family protein [Xylanimonas oleitrophica]|uniref:Phage holin family protein n=1 Tax=Xylanimonas oleitrophica TaxID=2607479 RepID=A0A2W5WR01_9MICO|nr:phage holin family protein [Xylanimonas oleitrophica]PZR53550.1 phage holin family protein [Xylanimonas oleitrophica]